MLCGTYNSMYSKYVAEWYEKEQLTKREKELREQLEELRKKPPVTRNVDAFKKQVIDRQLAVADEGNTKLIMTDFRHGVLWLALGFGIYIVGVVICVLLARSQKLSMEPFVSATVFQLVALGFAAFKTDDEEYLWVVLALIFGAANSLRLGSTPFFIAYIVLFLVSGIICTVVAGIAGNRHIEEYVLMSEAGTFKEDTLTPDERARLEAARAADRAAEKAETTDPLEKAQRELEEVRRRLSELDPYDPSNMLREEVEELEAFPITFLEREEARVSGVAIMDRRYEMVRSGIRYAEAEQPIGVFALSCFMDHQEELRKIVDYKFEQQGVVTYWLWSVELATGSLPPEKAKNKSNDITVLRRDFFSDPDNYPDLERRIDELAALKGLWPMVLEASKEEGKWKPNMEKMFDICDLVMRFPNKRVKEAVKEVLGYD